MVTSSQCTRLRAHTILQRYDHVTAGTGTPRHASYSKLLHACKCVACMKNALARNSDRYCGHSTRPNNFPSLRAALRVTISLYVSSCVMINLPFRPMRLLRATQQHSCENAPRASQCKSEVAPTCTWRKWCNTTSCTSSAIRLLNQVAPSSKCTLAQKW